MRGGTAVAKLVAAARLTAIAALVWSWQAQTLTAGQVGPKIKLVSREVSLGKVDPEIPDGSIIVDPLSRRIAYTTPAGEPVSVVVDGVKGRAYQGWFQGSATVGGMTHVTEPIFSPDGTRLAYIAPHEGKWLVVLDGREFPGGESPWGEQLTFSPDSKRFAFVAQRADKYLVSLDGVEGKPYDGVKLLLFSPDSQRLAYIAKRGKKELAVIDGVEGKEYDLVDTLYFSPDSKRTAYAALDSQKHKRRSVIDGVEGGDYMGYSIRSFCFSSDSQHVTYLAHRDGQAVVVRDGVEFAPPRGVGSFTPWFHPQSQRVFYLGKRGGKQVVAFDGFESKEYDQIDGFRVVSPDGKRVAFVGRRGGKSFAVVDGVEDPEHDYVFTPVFSPNSKRVAYAATRRAPGQAGVQLLVVLDGVERTQYRAGSPLVFSPDSRCIAAYGHRGNKCCLVVDDGKVVTEGEEHDELARLGTSPAPAYFSSDSQRMAWAARRGSKWFFMLNRVEVSEHDSIGEGSLRLSPDGEHFAFKAASDGKWRVVVDGVETDKAYDQFLTDKRYHQFLDRAPLVFDGPMALHTLAIRGGEFLRVEVQIVEP